MAMKKCKECGKEVSTSAKLCPHCGRKHPTGGLTLPAKIFLLIFGLFILGKVIGEMNNSSTSSTGTNQTSTVSESPKDVALRSLKLDFKWHLGGFENVMLADFTVSNPTAYPVKDIEITCNHTAKSGTKIDSNTRIIYDIVPANGKKTFKKFNMGWIHSQADSSSCRCTDLKIAN